MTGSHAIAACSPLMEVEHSFRGLRTANLRASSAIMLCWANASRIFEIRPRSRGHQFQEPSAPAFPEGALQWEAATYKTPR